MLWVTSDFTSNVAAKNAVQLFHMRFFSACLLTFNFCCRRYRRRLHRLLVDAAPPLPNAIDPDSFPSPLLLRREIRQVAYCQSRRVFSLYLLLFSFSPVVFREKSLS